MCSWKKRCGLNGHKMLKKTLVLELPIVEHYTDNQKTNDQTRRKFKLRPIIFGSSRETQWFI